MSDPLIEALEKRVADQKAKARAKAKKDTELSIYEVRDLHWSPKHKGEVPILFAYTFEPVVFIRHKGGAIYRGYASYLYKLLNSGEYMLDEASVGIHRTRREAKQRAYDLLQGWNVGVGRKPRFGTWGEPKG